MWVAHIDSRVWRTITFEFAFGETESGWYGPFYGIHTCQCHGGKQARKPSVNQIKSGSLQFLALLVDIEPLSQDSNPHTRFSHSICISLLKDPLNIVERKKPCSVDFGAMQRINAVFSQTVCHKVHKRSPKFVSIGELSSRQALKRKGLSLYRKWHWNSGKTVGYIGNDIFLFFIIFC